MIPLVHDTHEEYLDRPEISRGRIVSELENSPKKAKYDADMGTDATPAMLLGSAIHCAYLEPDRFDGQYHMYEGRRGTKEYAAFLEGDCVEPAHVLKTEDYILCLNIRNACQAHKGLRSLIAGMEKEVSVYWDGKKARFDAIGKNVILDLKSCRDITDTGIKKALTLSNMIQIPHYLEGAAAHLGIECDWTTMEDFGDLPSFIFAFVSKEVPIEVRLVEVPFEHVKRAAMLRHVALEQIKHNQETDIYPSYSDGIESFSPMPYVFPYEGSK